MRRTTKAVFACSLAISGSVLLSVAPAQAAVCTPPPPRSSPEGRFRIRTYGVVVSGTIGAVPRQPHGVYSLTLNVRRYYAGKGALTIVITNYGNLELHEGFEKPRNRTSTRASIDFWRRFGGQRAIFFITPRDTALEQDTSGRYKDEYSTHACLYNVVGDNDVRLFQPLLDQIFSQPAPKPGATTFPAPGAPSAVPTGMSTTRAVAEVDDSRSGPITRAGALALIVTAALLLYRNPRSPLFERWRR